jgi:hypothetical protein
MEIALGDSNFNVFIERKESNQRWRFAPARMQRLQSTLS